MFKSIKYGIIFDSISDMKKTAFIFTGLLISCLGFTQTISKISTFYNAYDNSSGIIGITGTGIYEYSWYFSGWMEFPVNGLAVVNGQPKIDEVSAFDNNSHNPSGIYVISDTAVHVYNYYSEFWYPLNNTGLERVDGVVQMSDLSAHYDAGDDDVNVYVKSGDFIYYYGWYTQSWYPLTNDGLTDKKSVLSLDCAVSVFPNPVIPGSKIEFTLPDNYKDFVKIAIFTEDGKIVKELYFDELTGGHHEFGLNSDDFKSGIYFYELSGVNFSHVKKFIKFE